MPVGVPGRGVGHRTNRRRRCCRSARPAESTSAHAASTVTQQSIIGDQPGEDPDGNANAPDAVCCVLVSDFWEGPGDAVLLDDYMVWGTFPHPGPKDSPAGAHESDPQGFRLGGPSLRVGRREDQLRTRIALLAIDLPGMRADTK